MSKLIQFVYENQFCINYNQMNTQFYFKNDLTKTVTVESWHYSTPMSWTVQPQEIVELFSDDNVWEISLQEGVCIGKFTPRTGKTTLYEWVAGANYATLSMRKDVVKKMLVAKLPVPEDVYNIIMSYLFYEPWMAHGRRLRKDCMNTLQGSVFVRSEPFWLFKERGVEKMICGNNCSSCGDYGMHHVTPPEDWVPMRIWCRC